MTAFAVMCSFIKAHTWTRKSLPNNTARLKIDCGLLIKLDVISSGY